jgi:hypothetical protein
MRILVFTTLFLSILAGTSKAAIVATYLFDNDFNAEEVGVAALNPIDPLGSNAFEMVTVFSESRTVYKFVGESGNNAGLQLDITGLIQNDEYTVELVFEFFNTVGYAKIIDTKNRGSDLGLYVDPGNDLRVYNTNNDNDGFVDNQFTHVAVTNSMSGDVNTYLNGFQGPATSTTIMDVSNDNILSFFLDDFSTSSAEFSDGRVALIRLHDNALSAEDVAVLAAEPFGVLVPIASPLFYLAVSMITVAGLRKRT